MNRQPFSSAFIRTRTAVSIANERLEYVRSSTFSLSHFRTSGGRVIDMVLRFLNCLSFFSFSSSMLSMMEHDRFIYSYCYTILSRAKYNLKSTAEEMK